MIYEIGDIVRQFTPNRRISWRGTVQFVGPFKDIKLDKDQYWIVWDNGSENRVSSSVIEMDMEYLRDKKLNEIL